jgi:type II secretory pathway component PulJ
MNSNLSGRYGWICLRQYQGVTLVELLVALGLSSIFCVALYGFYQVHRNVLKAEEVRLSLRESSRLAIDFMVRELHMAGARPVRGSACDGFERLTEAEAQRVTMQYDFRGASSTSAPDGCPDDPSEQISYVYNAEEQMLKRATSGGAPQPFIGDVPADGFELRYFDRDGDELTPPLTAVDRAAVRSLHIIVVTQATHPDPTQTDLLTSEFSSTVFLVNPPG